MVVPHQAPRIPPVKIEPIISRTRVLQKTKYRVHSLRNRRMDFRPLSLLKPIRIKSSTLILPSPRLGYEGVPYLFPDSVINWAVEYENTARIRLPFGYEQEIDGVFESGRQVLLGKRSIEISVPFTVTEAKSFTVSAVAIFRGRFADSVLKTFDIGLLRYKLKPVDEYPEDGLNEDLTGIGGVEGLKRTWRDAEKPSGDLSAYFSWSWAGFYPFRGIFFRPPEIYPTFLGIWGIRNNLPRTYVTVDILTPTPGVVYEDENHITWIGGGVKRVSIPPTTTRTYTFSQSFPPWMYGRILILNAVWTPPRVDIYYIRSRELKVGDMISPG